MSASPPTTTTDNTTQQQPTWTYNVRLGFLLSFVAGLADSIWVDTVMTAFLYATLKTAGKEQDDNTLVGAAEAAWGIAALVSALPVGYVADKISKAGAVRAGGILMFMAVIVSFYGVEKGSHNADISQADAMRAYDILLAGNVMWGVAGGVMNGPVQALFADSIPLGQRTKGYTILMVLYLVASSLGPVVSIILFSQLSDKYKDWTTQEIRPVFEVGLLFEIAVALLMLFFRDVIVSSTNDGGGEQEQSVVVIPSEIQEPLLTNSADEVIASTRSSYYYDCTVTKRTVPYLLFLSSLVTALGSGASVKFFPLFFENQSFTPIQVQWIFAASPLFIAAFTLLAEPLARRMGRIQAALLLETCGIVFLLLLAALEHIDAPRWMFIPTYLLRTALINSTYPIWESILMDTVPANERARWKSLEAVAAVGWTGSAVMGGVVSDKSGYGNAFIFTAILQFIGSWMVIPLIKVVPQERE